MVVGVKRHKNHCPSADALVAMCECYKVNLLVIQYEYLAILGLNRLHIQLKLVHKAICGHCDCIWEPLTTNRSYFEIGWMCNWYSQFLTRSSYYEHLLYNTQWPVLSLPTASPLSTVLHARHKFIVPFSKYSRSLISVQCLRKAWEQCKQHGESLQLMTCVCHTNMHVYTDATVSMQYWIQ